MEHLRFPGLDRDNGNRGKNLQQQIQDYEETSKV